MADPRLATVRRQVVGRVPLDGREARSRAAILAELDGSQAPFDQRRQAVHVTGSAVVLGPDGVLLHRHKRLDRWLQPGGHLEPDETPWDAARRETAEETGLQLSLDGDGAGPPPLLHVDVHDGGRGHTHLDLRYLLRAGRDAVPAPGPGESTDVRWFAWVEACAVADSGLRALLVTLRPTG